MVRRVTTTRAAITTRRAGVAVLVAMLVALGLSSPASAHTDFVGSSPGDGETVEGPVTDIVLTFTNPAVVAGDGFVLLTPDGTTRAPTDLDPTDGTEFIATFDPALTDGTYGFRWQVQAGDAHPIDGSFQFTVTGAPAPTTPATTAPAASNPATSAPATSTPAASDPATSTPATTIDDAATLEEFLDDDAGRTSPWLGRFGRILSIGGTIFAAGVTAALVWVVRGRRDELDHLLSWTRVAGVALVAGGLTEMAALLEASDTSFSDAATTRPGAAALLTLVGGVLVVLGLGSGVGRLVNPPRSLSAAVVTDDRASEAGGGPPDSRRDALQWLPDTTAVVGLVGIALAVAAYWFDGHTVSRGPWALHAAINLVHVGAASAWAGGVFAIGAVTALRRHRRSDTGLAPMIVRFSSIATVSLAALTVAGVALAWLVIDSVDDLWTSDWGRVLIAKVAIVALAASLGGYNHFKLRPELDARPDDPTLAHHLRVSLLVESILLAGAIVMTAVLVAAAT